ncbi:hypothetical protein E1212_05615 [Jiangella ureilytica]|uniref:Uncharacterized protein n=1 Tax=Jiangella ureilytica TaxID=2530374 RepID=A0A4R4RVJ6_9ACTN|nr:hypothetical protein [Jiangella ureilytica]TDC53389.1 hypothetical protein E1212_05615 [Jiangella ureilytica]
MTAPTPRPINPYQVALGILALGGLLVGLILVLANQPYDDFGYDEEGSAAGRAAGVLLLCVGAALGIAWLAVSALLWKPGPPRPATPAAAWNGQYDHVAPEPPRDHGTATLDR